MLISKVTSVGFSAQMIRAIQRSEFSLLISWQYAATAGYNLSLLRSWFEDLFRVLLSMFCHLNNAATRIVSQDVIHGRLHRSRPFIDTRRSPPQYLRLHLPRGCKPWVSQ